MMIKTLDEVEMLLAPYVAVAGETTGRGITTERTLQLSRAVGSPHTRLRVIHVAGTSGKTSTSYFISRLLAGTGVSVGLTVSPHITKITERVQLNTEPLNDELFCEYLSEFLPLVEASGFMPSYFELMMVFALWVFDKQELDYAVVETGLGGLHDSSNICRRADKVCVITDIGLDHTQILGETLPEIATQKAGIIATNNYVLMHEQSDDIINVVKQKVRDEEASLKVLTPKEGLTYQDHNSRLAYAAAKYIAVRDALQLPGDALSTLDTSVPGRMQIIKRGDVSIILDGAHNEQKTAALVQTLKNQYPGQKFAVIVAIKETKDYAKVVNLLSGIAATAIATSFLVSQDAPIRSIEPTLIQQEFTANGVECTVAETIEQAITKTTTNTFPSAQQLLITGSLYLLAQLEPL